MLRSARCRAKAYHKARLGQAALGFLMAVIMFSLSASTVLLLYASAEAETQEQLSQKTEEIEIWEQKYQALEEQAANLASENLELRAAIETQIALEAEALSRAKAGYVAEAIELSEADLDLFERVIEAEFTGNSLKAKQMGATVVVNRMASRNQTLREVIYAPHQFSVIDDGRAEKIKPSETTKQAVAEILLGLRSFGPEVEYFWSQVVPKSHLLWKMTIVARQEGTVFGKEP